MLKKSLIAGGAVLLLLALLFGRDACSYVSTTLGWVHDSVKQSVPIEFELERARKMIKSLTPEIERNMTRIATEEVKVKHLTEEIARAKEELAKARSQILRLNEDLKTGDSTFVYQGESYTAKQVKAELENRFARFKTQEATTDKLQKILRARMKGLEAAQQQLKDMVVAKRQLEVEVANLEARMRMVEVYQTNSNFNFDDSQLARTRELISEIQTRIDVQERLVNSDGSLVDGIPLEEEEGDSDITEQVTDYFGEGRAEIEAFVGAGN